MSKLRTLCLLAAAFLALAGVVALAGPRIAMAGDDGSAVMLPAAEDTNCIRGTVIDKNEKPTGAGLVVVLTDVSSQIVMSKTVDLITGAFSFGVPPEQPLAAGAYSVTLEIKEGVVPVTPAVLGVELSGNPTQFGTCLRIQFKIENPGTITFWKFSQESQLVPIPAPPLGQNPMWPAIPAPAKGMPLSQWAFEIAPTPFGPWQPGCVTTFNGGCVTGALTPGLWYVREVAKDGWLQTYPPAMDSFPAGVARVMVPQGGNVPAVFINKQTPPMCIDIVKINSLGTPMGGWDFTVAQGTVVIPATTSFGPPPSMVGHTVVTVHTPGVWRVDESPKAGWTAISPATGSLNVTVKTSNTLWPRKCAVVVFKNRADFKTLDVFKYNINTKIGLQDWNVSLYRDGNQLIATQQTNGAGFTEFQIDPITQPGPYFLCEEAQAGWLPADGGWVWNNVVKQWCTWPFDVLNSGTTMVKNLFNCQDDGNHRCVARPKEPPMTMEKDHKIKGPVCEAKYTVHAGDTLTAISRRFHVTVKDIQGANGLKSTLIRSGQSLCIPPDP
jgi:hypothetical protein